VDARGGCVRQACAGEGARFGSKEERRRLALQKLARVFGQRRTPRDGTAAERRVLREVLRKTEQTDVAELVQSRLDVLQVAATWLVVCG
jgi:transposase InsO family protein